MLRHAEPSTWLVDILLERLRTLAQKRSLPFRHIQSSESQAFAPQVTPNLHDAKRENDFEQPARLVRNAMSIMK